MKRFLLELSTFSVIVLAIMLLLNVFQDRYNNEPPHYKWQYDEATNAHSQYNSIIIGSSIATHGIRPSQLDTLERKYYNLALNGAPPAFYLKWLKNLFKAYHPKVDQWIVSTDLYFLSGTGWRSFEQDSEFFPSKDFWAMCMHHTLLDKSLLISNRIPVLKYRSRVLKSFEKNQGYYEFITSEYDRGFITLERNNTFNFDQDRDYVRVIQEDAKATYTELIDSLSTLGGEIIIIIPPEFNLLPEQYVDARAFLEKLSEKRNIPFYDFNDEEFHDKLQSMDNFIDYTHLTRKGSKIFSSVLKAKINARPPNQVFTQ